MNREMDTRTLTSLIDELRNARQEKDQVRTVRVDDLAALIRLATRAHPHPTGSGCPCEPSGSDGLRCPDASGKLLCDPAADRPGEQTVEVAWIDHTLSGVVLRTIGECTRLEDLPHGTKLYAQPRPAGADTNGKCKYCNGATEWFTSLRNKTQVVDGRLKTSDVECVFVLGCTECGETLEVRNADAVAASMTEGLG